MRALLDRVRAEGSEATVLVLRFGALGDILRTLPAVRSLRRALPEACLVWVADDRWAAVLDGHPDIDVVLRFPRDRWKRISRGPLGWPKRVAFVLDWRARLTECAPSLSLDFHGTLRSGISAALSRAPARLGYAGHRQKEGNRWFNNHRIGPGLRRASRVERNLDLVRALGVTVPEPLPGGGLTIPDVARQKAEDIVAGAGRYGVIAPGVSRKQAYKKPPVELLTASARALVRTGVTPLVVYGPGEERDAERVLDAGPNEIRLAPPTSLGTLAALLSNAELFVGGDTGPMHLACAVGCKVLALYGPTDPQVNTPWRVPHEALCPPQAVYSGIKREDRRNGFAGLTPDAVARSVDRLVGSAISGTQRPRGAVQPEP